MKKELITNLTEIVDTATGEVLTYQTKKVIKEKINSENFYMIYTDYCNRLYRISSGVAHNVFTWLCTHAEFNTGRVFLATAVRESLIKELEISDSQLTHALRVLKKNGVIAGERGLFTINPEIFWKGDQKLRREELLKNKELKITYEILDVEKDEE